MTSPHPNGTSHFRGPVAQEVSYVQHGARVLARLGQHPVQSQPAENSSSVDDRLTAMRRQLSIATDPVNVLLSETISTMTSGEPTDVRRGAQEFALRVREISALDREVAMQAAISFLNKEGKYTVADATKLLRAALADVTPEDTQPTETASRPKGQGSMIVLKAPEPWPDPVNGAELVNALCDTVKRYVVLSAAQLIAVALWVLFTYAHDAADISPLLAITSPTYRCGKSTLLHIVGALVPKMLSAANLTASSVFRVVEAACPTLLLDEADTFLTPKHDGGNGNDELRGCLNSGHVRGSAAIMRVVGDEHEPRMFSTWCPKAIALIGKLPDTVADRSIEIRMQRRAGEPVARVRLDRLAGDLEPLRRQAARWALDALDTLRGADPVVPTGLSDRAADNWRPLLAIADAIGEPWPEEARMVASVLSGQQDPDQAAAEVQLLSDLQDLFTERGTERLTTTAILARLNVMEERPWPEWRNGKAMTGRALARLLGRFGIKPEHWRDGTETVRGYDRKAFADAWKRYTAPVSDTPGTSGTSGTRKSSNDLAVPVVPDGGGTEGDGGAV